MKINYLNDWAIELEDLNLADVDIATAKEIVNLILSNLVVVIKNQTLTPEQEVNFCKHVGNVQYMLDPTKPKEGQRTEHLAVGDYILRVTGQKNHKGEEGLFGHTSAVDWHADQASNYDRAPLIWLYGVEGTKGSKTSWLNNIASYEAMSDSLKDEIKDSKITLGYKIGSYSASKFFKEHHAEDKPFSLVYTNEAGKTGLYFPFLQILSMPGKTKDQFDDLMGRLIEHVTQPQFMYDHHWEDGDVVISDQWLCIHKRWAYEKMADRVLHRIAFNYDNVL